MAIGNSVSRANAVGSKLLFDPSWLLLLKLAYLPARITNMRLAICSVADSTALHASVGKQPAAESLP